MAWNPNIPQPTDQLSDSQADLLGNFQALDPLVVAFENYVKLTIQGAAPATAANQLALYTKDGGGGIPHLFLREQSSGSEIDLSLKDITPTAGYLYLTQNLLLKWGVTATAPNNNAKTTYPFNAGPPAFLAAAAPTFLFVIPTRGSNVSTPTASVIWDVSGGSTNDNTQFTVYSTGVTSDIRVNWIALGRPA